MPSEPNTEMDLVKEELIYILNQVPLNIVLTDGEGEILWCNNTICNFTGYAREEMIGQNPRILKSNDNDHKIYPEMWDTIKNKKQIWQGKLKNKKKDGTLYEEDIQIIPVIRGKGKPKFFIGIQHDITEIERLRKRESVKQALKDTVKQIERISNR